MHGPGKAISDSELEEGKSCPRRTGTDGNRRISPKAKVHRMTCAKGNARRRWLIVPGFVPPGRGPKRVSDVRLRMGEPGKRARSRFASSGQNWPRFWRSPGQMASTRDEIGRLLDQTPSHKDVSTMSTRKKLANCTEATAAVTAIESNVQKLVRLLGHPDQDLSTEACVALHGMISLAAEPLAAAILRPRSEDHRLKAMFLAQFLTPDDSLPVEKALVRVLERQRNERIREKASLVLSVLIDKRMVAEVSARHQKDAFDLGSCWSATLEAEQSSLPPLENPIAVAPNGPDKPG